MMSLRVFEAIKWPEKLTLLSTKSNIWDNKLSKQNNLSTRLLPLAGGSCQIWTSTKRWNFTWFEVVLSITDCCCNSLKHVRFASFCAEKNAFTPKILRSLLWRISSVSNSGEQASSVHKKSWIQGLCQSERQAEQIQDVTRSSAELELEGTKTK